MSTALTVKDRAESALAPIEQKFNAVEGVKLAFNKELGFAVQILKNSDFLANIALNDPSELQAALYNVALTGLSLNPTLRLAYLLPRTVKINNQYVKKICLEPSYMGLIKILTDAGSVRRVWAECVYDADEFEVSLGTQPSIRHIPDYNEPRTDDKIIAAYAVAEIAGGLQQFEVMTRRQIDGIKARSESVKAKSHSPWDSDFSEMCRKTAVRRLYKYLPKTEIPPQTLNTLEIFDANNAIDRDATPESKSRLSGVWDAGQKQLTQGQTETVKEIPAEAVVLKARLLAGIAKIENGEAIQPKTLTAVAITLRELTLDNADNEDVLLGYLFGVTSKTALTDAQGRALISWAKSTTDGSGLVRFERKTLDEYDAILAASAAEEVAS